MAKKRAFDVTSIRLAIEKQGANVQAIAEAVGCTRGTVYAYLRNHLELQEAFVKARDGKAIEDKTQFSKEAFIKAIKESRGVKASVAAAMGCSRQTVDNALVRWPELGELFDSARSSLVASAVSALADDVENKESKGHQQAYMFVLKTLGKDEGFTERTEVTGADGVALLDLSPDVVKLVQTLGLDMAQIVKEFEGMVRAEAESKGVRE